jgi:hypothetical protein
MNPLHVPETGSGGRRNFVGTAVMAGKVTTLATILALPNLFVTVLLVALCFTSPMIWLLAQIVLAPSDYPATRLCWLLRAARGRYSNGGIHDESDIHAPGSRLKSWVATN